jgi:cyanophycinase
VIPTASVGDAGPPGMNSFLSRRNKERFGVAAVTVLHSLDRATSDSHPFVEALRDASGVWILGGFPANLIHPYLGTKTERAMRELLDRGGVVGGESAGAMIQASWLDTTDDEFTPEILALVKTYARSGFGLLANVAIFPHFNLHGSEAAVKFNMDHPDHLGVGIDEETALIVKSGRFEVVGQGTVCVYGGRQQAANPIVLRRGDRFSIATRE